MLLLAAVSLLGLDCHHGQEPLPPTAPKISIGPVPLRELAVAIHGARELGKLPPVDGGYGDVPIPVVPFAIVVTELCVPKGASRVECTWDSDRLDAYRAAYVDTRAEQQAMAERLEMLDAGVPLRDVDWYESTLIGPDWHRPVASAHFDDRLEPMEAPSGDDSRARRTYRAAFLCGEGNRAAILVDYVEGPLNGKGLLMVFASVDGTWHLIDVRGTWIA